jgi:hypothetical protein
MTFKLNKEWIEIEGTIERQTEKAILFFRSDLEAPEWYPKSQLEIVRESTPEEPITVLRVTKWIYVQKEQERKEKMNAGT